MSDQAAKLRELKQAATIGLYDGDAGPGVPMIVVAGARAGVGATTVAVNLAATLADRTEQVLIVDAAEHRNDLAEVAGVERDLEFSMAEVLAGKCNITDTIVQGPAGLQVLAGRGGSSLSRRRELRKDLSGTGGYSRVAQQQLLSQIDRLRGEIDLVVIDAGCGLTAWTRRFWLQAQLVVLVTTTEDASLLNAYAALKLSSADGIRPMTRLLINRAESDAAADAACRRVQRACGRFLSLSIDALPALPEHEDVMLGSASRAPRVWEAANTPFGHAALWLGRAVGDAMMERLEDAGCGGRGIKSSRREVAMVGGHGERVSNWACHSG
ncbi:MAG TPA: AAA family ATPase [Lacipirellulaceae bacterium]|nr:AAA family ATPase [Lacipirellulaceae bacterium]